MFPKARRKCPGQCLTAETAGDTGAEYGSKRRNGRNCKEHSRAGADGADFRKYTAGAEKSVALSPGMKALDKKLPQGPVRKERRLVPLSVCLDNGQEIGINANEPMISASLIKLYVAGFAILNRWKKVIFRIAASH